MDILYHYCSPSNFLSILSNRSIWLSSLKLSNDVMDGKLVSEIIERLAKHDGCNESIIKNLQNLMLLINDNWDGLGFCLSENGDLLSQWRGYASDATGFSIGFSKEYLLALSAHLEKNKQQRLYIQKVKYDIYSQEEAVRPTYNEVKKIYDSGKLTPPHQPTLLSSKSYQDYEKELDEFRDATIDVYVNLLMILPQLFSLKTAAFKEEAEWRIITHSLRDHDPCAYRAANDRIIPYKPLNLVNLNIEPVVDIKIGPKNLTPVNIIQEFLQTNAYKGVTVNRSDATYR